MHDPLWLLKFVLVDRKWRDVYAVNCDVVHHCCDLVLMP